MIEFNFPEKVTLSNRNRLKQFLIRMARQEGSNIDSLSIVFCSDEYLLDVNRNFLSHDYYTDIITFDLGSSDRSIEGEMYISVDRVRENAETFSVPFQHELHRVIFHGLLHLLGYGDKNEEQLVEMRLKESHYLAEYFDVPRKTVSV